LGVRTVTIFHALSAKSAVVNTEFAFLARVDVAELAAHALAVELAVNEKVDGVGWVARVRARVHQTRSCFGRHVRGEVWEVPIHEVRVRGIDRVRVGDGRVRVLHRDGDLRVLHRELVVDVLGVVDLVLIHEAVKLHQGRRHHERVGREGVAERLPRRDEREGRAGERLTHVLKEQVDLRRLPDGAVVGNEILEIGEANLRLLERELEEHLHLRRVCGECHPRVDEREQGGLLAYRAAGIRDRVDLDLGGRQAGKEVLHLRDVDERGVCREREDGRVGPRTGVRLGVTRAAVATQKAGRAGSHRDEEGEERAFHGKRLQQAVRPRIV
jgi:hypothetical protein